MQVATNECCPNLNRALTISDVVFIIGPRINANIPEGRILITGGGAKNAFLMEGISALSNAEIIIPSKEIIDFKEALIFAFLGVLRWHTKVNVLSSVTGAERDSSSGSIHLPQ